MKTLLGFRASMLALAVALGGVTTTAPAADLCLDLGNISFVLIDVGGGKEGKDMNKELGKANKCQVLSGVFNDGLGFAGLYATVSICTTANAQNANVIANFQDGTLTTRFPLPIPTTQGESNIITSGGSANFGIDTTVAVCSPPTTPLL